MEWNGPRHTFVRSIPSIELLGKHIVMLALLSKKEKKPFLIVLPYHDTVWIIHPFIHSFIHHSKQYKKFECSTYFLSVKYPS